MDIELLIFCDNCGAAYCEQCIQDLEVPDNCDGGGETTPVFCKCGEIVEY
jgi:hypothetical protein